MTDGELNAAAAEALGWTLDETVLWWLCPTCDFSADPRSPHHWSPATKIEHAWIVMQACDPQLFSIALRKLRPAGEWEEEWLATAPPRARTEAAVSCLKEGDGHKDTDE